MRYYQLTIKTKEANLLLEKVASYLPNPVLKEEKNPDFLSLEFYAQPQEILELEKKLKADSLKYLILANPSPQTKRKHLRRQVNKVTPRYDVKAKVELEQIEKKLEEILGE